MQTYWLLWGFNDTWQRAPIKLSGGTLAQCRAEQTRRADEGWTCGIYALGTAPEALRIDAALQADKRSV